MSHRTLNGSPRQLAIAKLAAQGLRNKEIAIKLGITEATVKVHLKAFFARNRIENRTALVSILGPVWPAHAAQAAPVSQEDGELLEFISSGFTNGELADVLDQSVQLVRSRVRELLRLMKVRNRTEAVNAWLDFKNRSTPRVGPVVISAPSRQPLFETRGAA